MRIRYAHEAIEDLVRLREFIETKNPLAARRVATEILTGIDKLKVFPKIGVKVTRAREPELIRDFLSATMSFAILLVKIKSLFFVCGMGKKLKKICSRIAN